MVRWVDPNGEHPDSPTIPRFGHRGTVWTSFVKTPILFDGHRFGHRGTVWTSFVKTPILFDGHRSTKHRWPSPLGSTHLGALTIGIQAFTIGIQTVWTVLAKHRKYSIGPDRAPIRAKSGQNFGQRLTVFQNRLKFWEPRSHFSGTDPENSDFNRCFTQDSHRERALIWALFRGPPAPKPRTTKSKTVSPISPNRGQLPFLVVPSLAGCKPARNPLHARSMSTSVLKSLASARAVLEMSCTMMSLDVHCKDEGRSPDL